MATDDFQLRKNMSFNVKWASIAHVMTYLIQFGVWVILARLLPPKDFGALGIALAFTNLIYVFGELGMSTAIIQRKDLNTHHLSTAFWITILICFAFLLSCVLLSGPIAYFFHNQLVATLLVLFAVKLMVDSFGTVHEVLLKRSLYFQQLAGVEIISSIGFGAVAVLLVFRGGGINSLAWGYIVKSIIKVFLLWAKVEFRPKFEFHRQSFDELFSFGKNIIGFKIISYIASNIDIALIGKFLGSAALGHYSLALNLVNFPRQKVSQIVLQVAFPAFSKIQDHPDELRNAYSKLIRYAAIVNFPLLFGLLAVSPEFVVVVYTSKWASLILPLQILCIYGATYSVTTFVGSVYHAIGKPQLSVILSLATLVTITSGILIGMPFGLVGVAIGLSIASMGINIFANLLITKSIGLSYFKYLQSLLPASVASMAMLCVLSIFRAVLGGTSEIVHLIVLIIVGGISYILALFIVERSTFNEICIIAKEFLSKSNRQEAGSEQAVC